jgi:hypothetical protein
MKVIVTKMIGSGEDSELNLILQKQKMGRRHLTELPFPINASRIPM